MSKPERASLDLQHLGVKWKGAKKSLFGVHALASLADVRCGVAHMRHQDVPKSPPGDIREACVFLALRGGLAELTPNQEWCVLHMFYKLF